MNYQVPKKNLEACPKSKNDYILKTKVKSHNKITNTKKNNLKYKNDVEDNKIKKDETNESKKYIKINAQKKVIYNHNINNKFPIYNDKYNRLLIIINFIINISLCLFCNVYSFNNLETNIIFNSIKYNSYEIKLKVKGTGLKNILSASSPYIYQCPSNIYLNEILIQDYDDCHYIDIKESDSEIKLIWNNNIESTKGMFYNCIDITEIDMTKFDTALVTDMSYMFAFCNSLKCLNFDNLNTEKVVTFDNMFYNCKSLTSLNLESFRNPSSTSLYRMFYGCENLEYINIKNLEEKDNMNINEMFDNISPNAVICFLQCPTPKNFIISSMNNEQTIISWERNEWNKYIISYGLQNLRNPEDGTKINVNDETTYIFTNLDFNLRYDIYIKTDCGNKYSEWIPTENYYMAHTGSYSIATCSRVIYDSGGPNGDYMNYADSILTIYPDESGSKVSIKGTIDIEISVNENYDHLYIYDGVGTSGTRLAAYHSGRSNIPLIISRGGPLTIKFITDYSVVLSGFELFVSCDINSSRKTIYNLIINNNCRIISCDSNWKNILNLFVLDTITCDNNNELNINQNEDYNCYPKPYNIIFDNNKNYKCLYNNNCPNNYKYIIEQKNQCVYNCKQYPGFSYEFRKKCYNQCPMDITELSQEKENYCDIKCPKEFPFELIEIQQCFNNCTLLQMDDKLCKLNFKSNNKTEINEIIEKMIANIKKEIINGANITKINEGEDIIIQEFNITVTITNNNNQKKQINSKTNNTIIDFEKCETKLKKHYNISDNESLYILKMDVKQEGYKIPIMQYEAYYPLNNDSIFCLLNLDICEDIDIDIYLPAKLDGNLEQYDPNSDFYNDICHTFTSEKGTDLTLSARKKNYMNNNLTVCEEKCKVSEYYEEIEKVKCSCKTKTDFVDEISKNKISTEEIYKSFTDFNNIFNIKILKCTNLIFTLKAFNENCANIILLVIIILYIICLIFFVFKSYNNDIKYYVNIIIYFIIKNKKKQETKSNIDLNKKNNKNSKNNNKNTINLNKNKNNKRKKFEKNKKFNKKIDLKMQNLILIKPPIYNIILKSKKDFNIKDLLPNPIKKGGFLNIKKRNMVNNIFDKKKSEEKRNKELIKKYDFLNEFLNLPKSKIYDLHTRIYKKTYKELNYLEYKYALKYDKRTFVQFYLSLLRCNHLLFFSFCPNFDFNSKIIKMYLFFLNFATYFFVNALFFTDNTINEGFTLLGNLPQTIYSSIISAIINEIIKFLALTENSFIEYRNKAKKKTIIVYASNLIKNFKIKFALFFILNIILLGCFWIYLSCFSAVYHNTQLHLIKDTFISFGTSFISPMGLYLLPGIFRIPSLKNKNRKIMYGINQILQLL